MALDDTFRQLEADYNARGARVRASLLAYSQKTAGDIERDMKRNAPWTDRTGNARNTLRATPMIFHADPERFEVGVVAGHGMEYGLWLEVRWAGRFAIVGPTVRAAAPRYFAGCRRIVNAGGGSA